MQFSCIWLNFQLWMSSDDQEDFLPVKSCRLTFLPDPKYFPKGKHGHKYRSYSSFKQIWRFSCDLIIPWLISLKQLLDFSISTSYTRRVENILSDIEVNSKIRTNLQAELARWEKPITTQLLQPAFPVSACLVQEHKATTLRCTPTFHVLCLNKGVCGTFLHRVSLVAFLSSV